MKEYKIEEVMAEIVIDVAPTTPKYPPFSRINFLIRIYLRLRIDVAILKFLNVLMGNYVNSTSLFKFYY